MIIAKCIKLDNYNELELNKEYEVDYADVERYHTDVYLKDIKGSFNSVYFKFYKDGKEINIVKEFIDSFHYNCGRIIKEWNLWNMKKIITQMNF